MPRVSARLPLGRHTPAPWVVVALASVALSSLLALCGATDLAGTVREHAYDVMLRSRHPVRATTEVVVVDIDRDALDQFGNWPWGREKLAGLVSAIAAARPKALGIDMLLVGQDERSPGALARNLAAASGDAQVATLLAGLADRLPDGDRLLSAALRQVPTVLGTVLDPDGKAEPPGSRAPILIRGRPRLDGQWRDEGVIGAHPALADAAAGHGVLSLPGDADAIVRRVPLMVATASGLQPGLALETARLSVDASSYLLGDDPAMLQTGPLRLRFPDDGMLRLRPKPQHDTTRRIVPMQQVLGDASVLAGRIVLIGSSAPELGGLRPASSGVLLPSVHLQADAVEQILRGDVPLRPRLAIWIEFALTIACTCVAMVAAFKLPPLRAMLSTAGLALTWLGIATLSAIGSGVLLDPLLLPVAVVTAFAGSSALAAAMTRRREALIRRRFEQHLSPAVVQRIVDRPSLLKLGGESRIVTALFTDIEGFTAMTERADPADLVSLLDRYIEGTSSIVVEHGGMVEKIVGDALHCIFNAPLDLVDHSGRALACALALRDFTDRLRTTPEADRLGLGRTRIGLETGRVIVGDVGGGRKLDYTAHGNAMNRAARLEAANKETGSSICVGGGAAEHIDPSLLRPLGALTLRGVDEPLTAFEPWPASMPQTDRSRYLEAMALVEDAPSQAAAILDELVRAHPGDRVVAVLRDKASARATAARTPQG